MKAPYFKLEQSEEAEFLSEILLSDKTPRRYIRNRAPRCSNVRSRVRRYVYLGVMTDSNTLKAFQNVNKITFCDELYVLYAKCGLPLCVSLTEKHARILYGNIYYTVTAKKVKCCRNPRKLYLAYLDMLPQSALDMGAFVSERKQYFLAPEKCAYDSVWTATAEVGNETHLSVNAAEAGVLIWKLYKILFVLDKNCNIKTVYSAVGKACGKYITRAEVTDTGEGALQRLYNKLDSFTKAKEILDNLI